MQQSELGEIKADFVCPFNAYHKLQDGRKLAFHIGRCKDRRGKTVYKCEYNFTHIFISPQAVVLHELR